MLYALTEAGLFEKRCWVLRAPEEPRASKDMPSVITVPREKPQTDMAVKRRVRGRPSSLHTHDNAAGGRRALGGSIPAIGLDARSMFAAPRIPPGPREQSKPRAWSDDAGLGNRQRISVIATWIVGFSRSHVAQPGGGSWS